MGARRRRRRGHLPEDKAELIQDQGQRLASVEKKFSAAGLDGRWRATTALVLIGDSALDPNIKSDRASGFLKRFREEKTSVQRRLDAVKRLGEELRAQHRSLHFTYDGRAGACDPTGECGG